jgi:hypothetical protein
MNLEFLSGDLVYLNVLGTSLLYVNSAEMAYELFDKRSAIYSDRPTIPMLELYVHVSLGSCHILHFKQNGMALGFPLFVLR